MNNAEETIRKIKELVTRQAEIEALQRIVDYALDEISRLKKEVGELCIEYDRE